MKLAVRLEEVHGFGPGFDMLRLVLAMSIMAIHVPSIAGTSSFLGRFWMLGFSPLPMFFALSGFLIAGSAKRLTFTPFILNRASRILPALAVEICLSAVILGPLVTEMSWAEYFSDKRFFYYFRNIVGMIQYELPGVFLHNPTARVVNGSLWTVPHEMFCYIIISLLMLSGLISRSFLILGATASIVIIGIMLQSAGPHEDRILSSLSYAFVTRGAARLVPAFLVGILIYHFRAWMVWDWRLALTAFGSCILGQTIGDPSWMGLVWFQAITTPSLAYLAVFLGLSNVPTPPFLKGGDYSYGIYLYAYPIQQLLIWLFPDVHNYVFHFVLSLALTSAFAALSWHFIEEPILRFRKSFSLKRQTEASPTRSGKPPFVSCWQADRFASERSISWLKHPSDDGA